MVSFSIPAAFIIIHSALGVFAVAFALISSGKLRKLKEIGFPISKSLEEEVLKTAGESQNAQKLF